MGADTLVMKKRTKETQCKRGKIYAAGLGCKRTGIMVQFAWDNYSPWTSRGHQGMLKTRSMTRIAEEIRRKFAWAPTIMMNVDRRCCQCWLPLLTSGRQCF